MIAPIAARNSSDQARNSSDDAALQHGLAPLEGQFDGKPAMAREGDDARGTGIDVTRRFLMRAAPRRASIALLAALTLSACTDTLSSLNTVGTGGSTELLSPIPVLQPSDEPITVENRRFETRQSRLGAAQHPQIVRTYGGLYSDPKVERAVALIVGRLTEASPNPEQPYRVYLLDSPSVNAFALPGGYLYVTRGLLALADDSAELAAVIAHEMAHVTANHGVERQRRLERTEIAQRVATRVMDDRDARTAMTREQLSAAQFSRAQELEADRIGIRTMAKAGFDPKAAVDFLGSMQRYTKYREGVRGGEPSLDFLATHPAAPQRLDKLRGLARSLEGEGGSRERERYLAGIDGMLFGDGSDEGYVRGRSFAHPRLGIAFDVPEGYALENGEEAVIATGPGDVALRFDGVPVRNGASPSDYLRSGWVAGLSETTVRETTIAGLPAARARAFAGGYAFDVSVVRVDGQFYRFLTAAPPSVGNLAARADAITGTFRLLSDAERAGLKPLRLVVRKGAGPKAMRGVPRAGELYKVLNPKPAGGSVKIVTDGR